MRVADSSRGVATSALAWASTATEWIWRRLLLTSSNMLLPAASVHGGACIDRELQAFGGGVKSGVIMGAHVRKEGEVYTGRCPKEAASVSTSSLWALLLYWKQTNNQASYALHAEQNLHSTSFCSVDHDTVCAQGLARVLCMQVEGLPLAWVKSVLGSCCIIIGSCSMCASLVVLLKESPDSVNS